jgi:preprotein translocase subunit SecD
MRLTTLSMLVAWGIFVLGPADGAEVGPRLTAADQSGEIVCTPSEPRYAQAAKSTEPWDTLQVVVRDSPTPIEAVQAEMDRIGGSRMLLEIDANDVRKQLLSVLRTDTVKTLREARIIWSRMPMVREGAVEVQVRDVGDVDHALSLLATSVAAPLDRPSARSAEMSDRGNGLIRLTPAESAVVERIDILQRVAVTVLAKRANQLGLGVVSVRPAGFGRIDTVLPGLSDPGRLTAIIESMARLEFRLVDTSMDACEAAHGQTPASSEILFRYGSKAPYLVKRQVLLEGSDLADAVVALDRQSSEPTVVFRLTAKSGQRFAKTTRENVGQTFAILLDNAIMARAVIREPLEGAVQLSGGFSLGDADQLAMYLRAGVGWLPRFIVIEQQIIDPLPAK